MPTEKLTAGLKKNITWTNPQTKNKKKKKKSHKLRLIRPKTRHKKQEQMHLKFLTPVTPFVKKPVNLLHEFKQYKLWVQEI
jgi:hypothetical protein